MIQNTDQCLVESLAMAAKEFEERDIIRTREIERLLKDHDDTYPQTIANLEKRLDAKADLMMRKLDDFLSRSNQENHSCPMRNSLQVSGN